MTRQALIAKSGGQMNVPFERVIWNADQCAEYLGESRAHFLRVTRYTQGFPVEIPGCQGKHPKWRAIQVSNWALGNPLDLRPIYTNQLQGIDSIA